MKQLMNKNRYDFLDEFNKGGICAEIGVFQGEFSTHIFTHMNPQKLHLIDVWRLCGKVWGGKPTDLIYQEINQKFSKEIASNKIIINEEWDSKFLPTFPDNYFDWVYIDSSHSYHHTKEELSILINKVKDDGVIAGHDWRPDKTHSHHGVFKAVHEFMAENDYEIDCVDNHLQWAIRKIK